MLTYEVTEDSLGVITSIRLSNGEAFLYASELEEYCKTHTEVIYGEELHRIAVVISSAEIKSRVTSRLRSGLTARLQIGKCKLVDMTEWKLSLKADEASVKKMEEIAAANPVFIGSSPAMAVNNAFYEAMGFSEGLARAKWGPVFLDAYLCSSKLHHGGFRAAYAGGMLASPADQTKVYTDVQSYDITSAYPYAALITQVPMGASIELPDSEIAKIKIVDGRLGIKAGFGFIALLAVKNARRKSWVRIPLLREHDEAQMEKVEVVTDRLGVVSGDLRMAMCPEDLEIFNMQYDYDEIKIHAMTVHRLGSIPTKAANFIIEAFDKKNTAPRDTLERDIAKTALNTIIGFWGSDPFQNGRKDRIGEDGIVYSEHKGKYFKSFTAYLGNFDAPEDKHKPGHSSGKYRTWDFRWATYITAANRLRIAKAELACFEAGLEVVYCDTDSLKVSGPAEVADAVFDKLNEDVKEAYDYDGIGLWLNESEGYHRAAFRGPKVYIYENENGEKIAKISGISGPESKERIDRLSLEDFCDTSKKLPLTSVRRRLAECESDFGGKLAHLREVVEFAY